MSEDADFRLAESMRLHAAVRAFADRGGTDGDFESLALEIARYQCASIPGFRRLVKARSSALDSVMAIPAVPVDAFRYAAHFAFPREASVRCFRTSGTTAAETGKHYFRDLATYDHLATRAARRMLVPPGRQAGAFVVVALLPYGGEAPVSSLAHMCGTFMQVFDGRALTSERTPSAACANAPERWLFGPDGTRLQALQAIVRMAHQAAEPVLLLATSFALVDLLEKLADETLPLPAGSVVMPTGGFKGRVREVAPTAFRDGLRAALGEPTITGEYGMTELSSQLYEAGGGDADANAEGTLFRAPPWLRVIPLSPATLEPVPPATPGLASFVDLGNVDSAVRVVTQDLVVAEGDCYRLLGRRSGAPLRGCSLATESVLLGLGAGPLREPLGRLGA